MASPTLQEECDNIVKELTKMGAHATGCFDPNDDGKKCLTSATSHSMGTIDVNTKKVVDRFYKNKDRHTDKTMFEDIQINHYSCSFVLDARFSADERWAREVYIWFFDDVVIVAFGEGHFSDMNKYVQKTTAGSSNFCFGGFCG